MESYLSSGLEVDCTGCLACKDACNFSAINIEIGSDKAIYPCVDKDKCVGCGRCQQVCHQGQKLYGEVFSKLAYAGKLIDDEMLNKSASGGAFDAICKAFIELNPNGYISGAEWSQDFSVLHTVLPGKEYARFKKSKYLQSNTDGIFKRIRELINRGIPVLFSGTPCQIAALKSFIGKSDLIYTIDIVCQGVAGAAVFKKFVRDFEKHYGEIERIEFRYKKKDLYGELHSKNIFIKEKNGKEIIEDAGMNSYLRGCHSGLFYRSSCYNCHYANENRVSDITIGDYWNIQALKPDLVDYSGVSCLLVNSERGNLLLKNIENFYLYKTTVKYLLSCNGQLVEPTSFNRNSKVFWEKYENIEFNILINELIKKPSRLSVLVRGILPGQLKRKVRGVLDGSKIFK